MNAKRMVKSITAMMLVGAALEASHAEDVSKEPAAEVQTADTRAATVEVKVALPAPDASASAANPDSTTISPQAGSDASAVANVPSKAGFIEWAVDGVSALFDRAKTFVIELGK